MWKMDPMSGFDIRLVFTLPPSDSTLQYKRCIHLWNNFPYIKSFDQTKSRKHGKLEVLQVKNTLVYAWSNQD